LEWRLSSSPIVASGEPFVADAPASTGGFRSMVGFLVGASAMFATMYSTQGILPEIGRVFDVTPSRAGLTISVLILAVVAGSWVWGPLSDRIGRRTCLIAASALLVPASIAVALAPSFELLLLTRVVQGLVLPGLLVVGIPYVSEVFVPAFGARAMGWYMASLISGGLIGRLGVALLASAAGWRLALGTLAALPLVAVIVMMRGLPPAPLVRPQPVQGSIANRRVIAAALAGPSLFFVFVGVFSYIGFRLESAPFNLPPTAASLVFALWVVGAIAPVAGRFAERVGWARVALIGIVAAAIGVGLTVPDVLATTVIGLGFITIGMFTVVTAAPIGVGGAQGVRPGAASALYYSIYYTAGALGAYVPGLAWQAAGWVGVSLVVGAVLLIATLGARLGQLERRNAPVSISPVGLG
jgi:MFS transporter, YNFM family, putative membrane transport protein